ncbi:MAG TPA: hypothetical protein VNW97_21870 [Candidatus Saccharimonadales bacterium]|jgi:hypothetical protein|nr:hypothetical protein [Candidatus Saccharimonadales bacterium]
MKKLRLILMVLAAPAATLLGLHELGGTPISKGYDTGFHWQADPGNNRLILTIQPEGDLSCWVRLKMSQGNAPFTAKMSTNDQLRVYKETDDGGEQWIAIAKQSQTPQDKFNWTSGASLYFSGNDNSALAIHDWYVFSNNKSFDSKQRADWREELFWIAAVLLVLALAGGILEWIDKKQSKPAPFSPQLCVEGIIADVEGADEAESTSMRSILRRVLIEGTRVDDALVSIQLSDSKKRVLWFKTAGQFRHNLQFLIDELARYLERTKP